MYPPYCRVSSFGVIQPCSLPYPGVWRTVAAQGLSWNGPEERCQPRLRMWWGLYEIIQLVGCSRSFLEKTKKKSGKKSMKDRNQREKRMSRKLKIP